MYEIVEEKMIRNITNSVGQRTALSLVHIVCDTASDMPEPLPHWISGSRCDVLENGGSVYLLSSQRTWTNVNFYNQGGEGGGFDPDDYYTKPQTDAKIAGKVDKITGKGLSTEDYTTAEKTKLAELSNYDDTQVYEAINSLGRSIGSMGQAVEGKVDKIAGKGLSTEDYTTAEKTKLAGLSNYDDTALTSRVSALEDTVGDINTILEEVL